VSANVKAAGSLLFIPLSGAMVGFLSPEVTVREPALGIALAFAASPQLRGRSGTVAVKPSHL